MQISRVDFLLPCQAAQWAAGDGAHMKRTGKRREQQNNFYFLQSN
jgi:hypothetical protein